jgi:NAD(P)-dependent dehydrogenase (short-subunit alcohol dehydrogenase family)
MQQQICKDRVVVITGAARGSDVNTLEFARQGAKVVVNDLVGRATAPVLPVRLRRKWSPRLQRWADKPSPTSTIADWEGARRMIQTAIDHFGGLDVLVNNAGILRDRTLANMTEDDWDAVIRVHLRGTFAPARHAAAYWRDESKAGRQRAARLINTSSSSGLYAVRGRPTMRQRRPASHPCRSSPHANSAAMA